MQKLASIQPRTSLVKFARCPSTDPPGDNFASHIFSARTAKHVPRRRREEHKEKRYVQLQKYDCGTSGMLEAISAVMSVSRSTNALGLHRASRGRRLSSCPRKIPFRRRQRPSRLRPSAEQAAQHRGGASLHCEGSGKLERARSRLYRGQILQ